jgi:hypothetical protein
MSILEKPNNEVVSVKHQVVSTDRTHLVVGYVRMNPGCTVTSAAWFAGRDHNSDDGRKLVAIARSRGMIVALKRAGKIRLYLDTEWLDR